MTKQMTLGTGFEKYSKTTRRETFVPWGDLCADQSVPAAPAIVPTVGGVVCLAVHK